MPDMTQTDTDLEQMRLAELRRYGLLDTGANKRFDGITQTVAKHFDVPIAAISLIDKDRQWFKSCCGWDLSETPRDQAFCDHTMRRSLKTVFVVNDPTRDDRFKDNPLVRETEGIRFYAGSPLVSPCGLPLGALCIIDKKPRPDLNRRTLGPLITYADRCMALMEDERRAAEDLQVKRALAR